MSKTSITGRAEKPMLIEGPRTGRTDAQRGTPSGNAAGSMRRV
jgi:hypothetical protein